MCARIFKMFQRKHWYFFFSSLRRLLSLGLKQFLCCFFFFLFKFLKWSLGVAGILVCATWCQRRRIYRNRAWQRAILLILLLLLVSSFWLVININQPVQIMRSLLLGLNRCKRIIIRGLKSFKEIYFYIPLQACFTRKDPFFSFFLFFQTPLKCFGMT